MPTSASSPLFLLLPHYDDKKFTANCYGKSVNC